MSLLIVHEEGAQALLAPACRISKLQFRFIENPPQDGFSGWASSHNDGLVEVDVAARCRELGQGLRAQALNRFFARMVLQERPAAVLVYGLWGCTVDLPRLARMMGVPCILVLPPDLDPVPDDACAWLQDALHSCRFLVGESEALATALPAAVLDGTRCIGPGKLGEALAELLGEVPPEYRFSYSSYEFLLRHPHQ